MSKGSSTENELCDWFWENDFSVLRAPGSGSIPRPSPDVVAIGYPQETREVYAIEVKARDNGRASFDGSEIRELEAWADRSGGEAWVVVKPDLRSYSNWVCLETTALNETQQGNYSIRSFEWEQSKSLSEAFLQEEDKVGIVARSQTGNTGKLHYGPSCSSAPSEYRWVAEWEAQHYDVCDYCAYEDVPVLD